MSAPIGRRIRVAVVFGGRSTEHAISCVTAGSVLAAIDRDKYEVVPIGIAPDGRWVLEADDPERLRITGPGQLPAVDPGRPSVALARVEGGTGLVVSEPSAPPRELGEVDVVLPLLHGPWGEDGTIQGLLEMSDVRYVGSGVLASAVCMDKAYMKVVLAAAGLPVMPGTTTTAAEWSDQQVAVHLRCEELGYPLFVKPARGGSSFGISKVHSRDGLAAALEEAFRHDPKVVIEVSAEGAREIECGVLDSLGGIGGISHPAEIRITGEHEFYDFEAKYLPEEATELDVPALIDEETSQRMLQMAGDAFRAVGCEGLARVDFFLLPDGRLVINELNTMPGFTPTSMFPRMWAATGVSYAELIDHLISLALARPTGLR